MSNEYAKLANVINSVETTEQYEVARNYAMLFLRQKLRELKGGGISTIGTRFALSRDIESTLLTKFKEVKAKECDVKVSFDNCEFNTVDFVINGGEVELSNETE